MALLGGAMRISFLAVAAVLAVSPPAEARMLRNLQDFGARYGSETPSTKSAEEHAARQNRVDRAAREGKGEVRTAPAR